MTRKPGLYGGVKIRYRDHNRQALLRILNQNLERMLTIYLRCILILSYHIPLGFTSDLFTLCFRPKICVAFSSLPSVLYAEAYL
jgi:hypothetical protein